MVRLYILHTRSLHTLRVGLEFSFSFIFLFLSETLEQREKPEVELQKHSTWGRKKKKNKGSSTSPPSLTGTPLSKFSYTNSCFNYTFTLFALFSVYFQTLCSLKPIFLIPFVVHKSYHFWVLALYFVLAKRTHFCFTF